MEVKINREIRNYTESMFFGLSLRQFIFSVLACGVAVRPIPLMAVHMCRKIVMCRNLQITSLYTDTI